MMDRLPNEIFQVLIVSKDVEKTAKEFAALFGMEVPRAVILDPEEIAHAKYRGKSTGTRAKVIPFLGMGGMDVEIIQPDDKPSIWREFLEEQGEGVSHLGIWVQSVAEAVAFMEAKGFQVAHQASFVGGKYAIMDTRKALGVYLMLKQQD